jgi:hypothetical protein
MWGITSPRQPKRWLEAADADSRTELAVTTILPLGRKSR